MLDCAQSRRPRFNSHHTSGTLDCSPSKEGPACFARCYTLALVCALAAPAAAQTASVSGTITDQTGAAVPGATVTLDGPGGTAYGDSGSRGEYSFTNLANGSYKVTATLSGFAPGTRDVVVSGANVEVPAISLALASLSDTIVVSATKSDTALIDAPATISVVTSEVLASTPAQNYGDLLRSLPGVNVIQMSARDVNVTSRQGTSTLTNSQLVLLDGRSIYLDFFGLVLWDFLPANMSDIKQIEVIRGPASAVWGANALTGVVNIITKTPRAGAGHDGVAQRRVLRSRRRLDASAKASASCSARTPPSRRRRTPSGRTACRPATSTPIRCRGRPARFR